MMTDTLAGMAAGLVLGVALGTPIFEMLAAGDEEPAQDSALRLVTYDDETDGATGSCMCSSCRGKIDPYDRYCRTCGAWFRASLTRRVSHVGRK